MKILMLAPEPFFSPRGTPFSEYHRISSLCRQGHKVDLITYPIGRNVVIEGLTIHRCLNPLGIKKVKTGPSLAKMYFDFFMFLTALRLFLFRPRYDLIHSHEEAALLAVFLRFFRKVPHLYDMHSSLVQQMDNFQTTRSSLILRFFRWFERTVLTDAASVIVICKTLHEHAAKLCDPNKLTIIENFVDDTSGVGGCAEKPQMPQLGEAKIILYAGTLETYQGIPLLLEATALLPKNIVLWLAGGQSAQIEALRRISQNLQLGDRIHFFGQLAPEQIAPLIQRADVLVSPRSRGTNIPLKVYSYLKSGKPLVATDILSHTQTLTPDISILVKPEAQDMARGLALALTEKGAAIAAAASRFCEKNYSVDRYDELVTQALRTAGVHHDKSV